MRTPRRVVVLHRGYGCDTGCCGHIIEINGEKVGRFDFSHPSAPEDFREWAAALVEEQFPGHSADLDWENCEVSEW